MKNKIMTHLVKTAQATTFLGVVAGTVILFQNCGGPKGLDVGGESSVEEFSSNMVEVSSKLLDPAVPEKCIQVGAKATEPRLKWQWLKGANYTNFDQVMAAPVVGDLNADGNPEVVVTYFSPNIEDKFASAGNRSTYNANGVLRILSGATGREIASVGTETLAPAGHTTPLLSDLDGDGRMEIIYLHFSGTKIIALNSDATFRWSFAVPEGIHCMDGLSAHDTDRNGRNEILTSNYTIEENAAKQPFKKVTLQGQTSANSCRAIVIATRDDQTALRFLTHAGIFNLNGNSAAAFATAGAGIIAIGAGDVRADAPGNEVIRIIEIPGTGSSLQIINSSTGVTLSSTSLDAQSVRRCSHNRVGGGPLTVGNFDDNPNTYEIAVATGQNLMIFSGQGSLIAASETQDCSSVQTGMSSFDFNGDGKPELLYGDEEYFRIYSYRPGQLLEIFKIVNPTGTLLEYPVVADIDGNGTAELLVVSNNYAVNSFYRDPGENLDIPLASRTTGIRAFTAQVDFAWMKTRPIWNQHYYQPSYVSDNGQSLNPSLYAGAAGSKSLRVNMQLSMQKPECILKTDITKGTR